MSLLPNTVVNGNCLEVMKEIDDASIDMILCDLPYGATQNSWDSVIPPAPLWEQYERIIKPNGAILLFGQDKFTATMMPRSNNDLSSYLKHWCEIKNTQRHGEAGLQLSINSTSDDQREAQFAGKSLSLREIANIASELPMPVGRKYTLNFAVTEATILDAKVLDSLFDRDKFIVKITPIHQTKAALEHNYDITTSYDDYSVYDKFEQPLLDLGWDVIVFFPSKEEDSDRITCGNALISEV